MTWVKIDDQFYDHPKAVKAGRDGRDLFIAGLCHCAAQLSDGLIDAEMVPLIAFKAGISNPKKAAGILVSVGLWDALDGGFHVHDYLEYNPCGAKVKEERAAAKQRMERLRSGGHSQASPSKNQSRSENVRPNKTRTSESVRSHPYPSPYPYTNDPLPPTDTEAVFAAELEDAGEWDLTQRPSHSRTKTQAQSATAEGSQVCGAAAAVSAAATVVPVGKPGTKEGDINLFVADYPHMHTVLAEKAKEARTSPVAYLHTIVMSYRQNPESIPEKPVSVPRKRTPEELKAIRAQRDKEASDEFWTRQEAQTGKPRAELIAEADRMRTERANGANSGGDNFGWLDKLAPKSVSPVPVRMAN